MGLFSRVLVPLDGTPQSEVALNQLRPVLRREGGEITLLRAAQLPFVPESGAALRCAHSFLNEAADYLARLAEALRAEGLPTRIVSKEGPAQRAILSEARMSGASMIAMTTRGRGGLARWLMGSVTEQVLRESPVPVWVTRATEPPEPPPDPLELDRILVPLEPGERPEDVLSPALEFARIFGARLLVLRLLGGKPIERLSGLGAALGGVRRRGLRFETIVEGGDPASAIATAARHRQAGLVALREPPASGWMRSGRAERVLRSTRVPLFVARGA